MENIAEWGKIVSILVDNLGLTQFDILGISSGAPYSYSIGYKLQDRVRSIFIFSGTPALFDDRVLELWPYPIKKNASIAEMEKVAKEVFFSNVTKEDMVKNDIRDSMMNDCFGIAQDLRIRCMDWGFRLSEIRSAVYMEHSRTDNNVPFVTAEMTAKMLPNCQMEAREGDHFSEETLDQFIKNIMLNQTRKPIVITQSEERPTRGLNRPSLRPEGKAHVVFAGACCILNLRWHSRPGGSTANRWAELRQKWRSR